MYPAQANNGKKGIILCIGWEGRLTYLRTLVVGDCPSLTSLTLSIKHLTALETLIIRDCKELSLMEEREKKTIKISS
ncbi:hypothetical protein CFP56_006322 [Quercus suber]|uniref:Uncharacterized protein n=1 Tax=Quercus suber TaxID=58331 RepID=A0AAW0L8F8_QUESU